MPLRGVVGQGAVEQADNLADVRPREQEGTQVGAQLGHQQGWAEAVAADVADDHPQTALAHGDVVEVIAARRLGWVRCPADVEAGRRQRGDREELLLDLPGQADFLAQTFLLPALLGLGHLPFVFLALDLAEHFRLLPDLLGLPEQVHEHRHLRPAAPPGRTA